MMKSLVGSSDSLDTKIRRVNCIWPVLTTILFFIAVTMAGLFISEKLKTKDQQIPTSSIPNRRTIDSPCPQQPPLLALPSPLPEAITESLQTIDKHLKSMAEQGHNKSAMSMKISYRSSVIWSGHYGAKVYEGSVPPDDDTRYRIGSVTKLFPIILLYKLNQDGLIASLDDPLSKYAPDFFINNPFTHSNITLRQIANQMSGLPREAPCGYMCGNTSSADQLALLRSENLVIEPWTAPSYSNLGYALLGRLLTENLLNTTFEDWIEKEVLQPLGMHNTGTKITEKVMENMALPYNPDGKVRPFMTLDWVGPAGDMYSTVNDLMKLAKMFTEAEGHGILRRETIRQILLPDFITPDGLWLWGSPWEMRFTESFVARQKGGNIDTYNAVLSVIPEMELSVSVLVNVAFAFKDSGFVCFKVADFVHATLLPALNKTLFELEKKALFPVEAGKPFVGDFLVAPIKMSPLMPVQVNMTIIADKGVLTAIPHGSGLGVGFVMRYIGKPLMFQAMSMAAENAPCIMPHLGVLDIVTFDPPGPSGLSDGFTAPSWKITGKRIKSTSSNVQKTSQETPRLLSDGPFFIQPY